MSRFGFNFTFRIAFLTCVFLIILNVWLQDTRRISRIESSRTPGRGAQSFSKLFRTKQLSLTSDRQTDSVTMKDSLPIPIATIATTLHVTPAFSDIPLVWPDLAFYNNDRILNQMRHLPKPVDDLRRNMLLKKILLIDGLRYWDVVEGQRSFIDQKCPVNTCSVTVNPKESRTSDAVLFRHFPRFPWFRRPANQIWILYMLESPSHTPQLSDFANTFNWTATYRRDSDIVAPYEKFLAYQGGAPSNFPARDYARGKSKMVAWFVSNCKAQNQRLEYAKELARYIQVDIYGKCGDKKCSRKDDGCFKMLDKDYRFYLAFENSNCRDYITEKFYVTGLQHDVIPIVMGAAPEDYERAAPHHSYIHVDEYESARALAKYLHKLASHDDLYNEYFRWKGTGSFVNTYFWCRLCAMLHDQSRGPSYYGDLQEWWRGEDVCIGRDSWRQHPRKHPYISDYYLKRTPTYFL